MNNEVLGRDRKTLWAGVVQGMATAAATILFQDRSVLF